MIFLKMGASPMKKAANNDSAIPCIVLTFTPDEIAIVNETLEVDGYEDDLKQWILDNMLAEEAEPSRYSGAADRVIENVAAFVRENPGTIRAAGTIAGNILGKVIKKGPRT